MTFNGYVSEIVEDGKEFIKETLDYNSEASFEDIMDDMFVSRVTGNDNGSYYCNSYQAEEAVKDVIFEDWFEDMCHDFGIFEREKPLELLFDPEGLDVSVRCYLLGFQEVREPLEEFYENCVNNIE